MTKKILKRCEWCAEDPLYQAYHDNEWGVPTRDDQTLFEFLLLEGAQAGLSWITVLRKREGYRAAYDNFDATRIARYSDKKIARLLQDPHIIRNKLKVASAVKNAQAYLDILDTQHSFSDFLWQFVDGKPVQNRWRSLQEIPASTDTSDIMSKQLKNRVSTLSAAPSATLLCRQREWSMTISPVVTVIVPVSH